jgi:cobalt-zinc-cadmium efflux system membrane fusion protein
MLATGCSRRRQATEASEPKPSESKEKAGEEHEAKKTDRVELTEKGLASLRLSYARAEERDLSPALAVTGEVVPIPDRHAEIGSLVAGRVVSVMVNVGDKIKRGSPVVVLRSAEIGKAQAELTGARARVAVARQNYERERSLFENRATSQREVQQAEGALKTAEADVQAARAMLATAGVGDRALQNVSEAGRLVLSSPIDGTVIARAAVAGRNAEPSSALVEVANLDEVWFLGDVFERDIGVVSEGQEVQVEVRAYPGAIFRGRISLIGGTLDEKTRTVKIRVVLPNANHRLRPGMFATARIEGAHAHEPKRMLVIPWAAVQEIDNHQAVFVRVSERAFELRRIHTGERAGDFVEVSNGVHKGDEVVGEGSFLLKGELLRASLGESE